MSRPGPFSSRSGAEQTPNALTRALERRRSSGEPVLDLTVSNPTRAGVPYDTSAIVSALADARSLVYDPQPFGAEPARRAVCETCAVPTDPSRVVLLASTSEAYAHLFKLLCDPGDEVLVPRPSYPLFEHLARLEAVRLVPYRLAYDGRWHVDLDSLRAARSPRTRAILAVSPNNPTGSYTKRSELRAIQSLGLPVISDEVFATYSLVDDATRARSALEAATDAGLLVFALGGLSKLAALPQMKAAWIVTGGRPELVREALARLELIADSFLSVGTPVQHALVALLRSRGVAETAIRDRLRANLSALQGIFGPRSAANVLHVEGGWYATLRLPLVQDEESWSLELLERDGVYVHPGHFFDFEQEAHLVLSLLTPSDVLAEGARRIARRVEARAG
jgi:aspartate/methionine/tyrosine aminotransferase